MADEIRIRHTRIIDEDGNVTLRVEMNYGDFQRMRLTISDERNWEMYIRGLFEIRQDKLQSWDNNPQREGLKVILNGIGKKLGPIE